MKKLVTLVLACALLGPAIAATAQTPPPMSCFVDTPAYDEFTPEYCFAVIPGARFATAVFRALPPPLPNRFEVRWSDTRCDPKSPICSVRIAAYRPKTMTALVLNFDNFTFYEVSATAELEAGY